MQGIFIKLAIHVKRLSYTFLPYIFSWSLLREIPERKKQLSPANKFLQFTHTLYMIHYYYHYQCRDVSIIHFVLIDYSMQSCTQTTFIPDFTTDSNNNASAATSNVLQCDCWKITSLGTWTLLCGIGYEEATFCFHV